MTRRARFWQAIGRTDIPLDPRFNSLETVGKNYPAFCAEIEKTLLGDEQKRLRKKYVDRLKENRTKTGEDESMLVAAGTMGRNNTVIAIQNFAFLGGSLSMAGGEAMVTASGIEGGVVYALSGAIRDARTASAAEATAILCLRPKRLPSSPRRMMVVMEMN